MEKQNLTPGSEATRGTRPHIPSLEAWQDHNKSAQEATKLKHLPTTEKLKIYKAHTAKATEAVKGISEGLRASLGLGWIPNQLDLKGGGYNPDFINWLDGDLTNTALALSEILTYDEIDECKGFIKVYKEKAGELIADVQNSVKRFKDEAYNITNALEYYNYYRGFIEERGLKDDFNQYLNALFLAKG